MAFLDNSGDIILDAVLTDTGRMRMAKGDGSFKIAKFALGDDEIDYTTYDLDHSSGTAYFDLEILQTPILEAFTNNTSSMKSKLVSYGRTNLLYLPVIKWYSSSDNGKFSSKIAHVLVDDDTEKLFTNSTSPNLGLTARDNGLVLGTSGTGARVVLEQGLDTTEISYTKVIDGDFKETNYIIQIDNRLASLVELDGQPLKLSHIDDDNIASYYVTGIEKGDYPDRDDYNTATKPPKSGTEGPQGPFGTALILAMKSSIDAQSSTFLFTRLGTTTTPTALGLHASDTTAVYSIESTMRIVGANTGFSIDIPVRFVKKV